MPVVKRGRKTGRRGGKSYRLGFEQKIAKLAIADYWASDSDGTKYYVNVAVFGEGDNARPMVRFRIDIPGEEPLILALDAKTAMTLGMALQRAAFAAQVLNADEVRRLWAMAKGKSVEGSGEGGGERGVVEEGGAGSAARGEGGTGSEEELPDISFA